jgi:hypothetical protein
MSEAVRSEGHWFGVQTLSPLALGMSLYGVSGLFTLILLRALGGAPQGIALPLLMLALGTVLPVGMSLCLRAGWPVSRVFELSYGILMVVVVLAICRDALPLRPYGDRITRFVEVGYVFPRWLLGMAVATWLHVGLWKFPPIASRLPPELSGTDTFTSLLCSLVMAIGTIAILRRWPGRLSVMLPLLTPVWVLFATGYTEYYTLVAGAWLACLVWLFEKPLDERSPLAIGAMIGILPALYVGFAGLGLIVGLICVVSRPNRSLVLLGAAAATLAAAIAICWPDGVARYLVSLYGEMNFGEEHTMFRRYVSHSASAHSIFFSTAYALSPTHLGDLAYIATWSGGWMLGPALGAALVVALRQSGTAQLARVLRTDTRIWLGLLLALWQIYYFLFMIPKAGPTRDVDLFFSTIVTLGFLAGRLLDISANPRRSLSILSALAGSAVVTAVFLAWIGLPRRP